MVGLCTPDPVLHFPALAGSLVLSGIGWIGLLRLGTPPKAALPLVLGLWSLALAGEPAMSKDSARYVFEGRVVWYGGPSFPFRIAPSEAPKQALPRHLFDETYREINHPTLSTIYPPFAQLVFALAGGLGELFGGAHGRLLRFLLSVAALCSFLALGRLVPRLAGSAWLLAGCPVLVFETAREGHADSLSVLGLALFAGGFVNGALRRGFAGLAISALAKLQGVILFPLALRSTRRGALLGTCLLWLLALPILAAGPTALTGLAQYASRWRAGDGSFGLVLAFAEFWLGGDHRYVDALGVTLTRHQLARGLTLVFFGLVYAGLLVRQRAPAEVPKVAGVVLLMVLLLGPTLHPWYTSWLLPFVPFMSVGRASALVMLVASPVLHHPTWLEATTGAWTDLPWVRALVHMPAWALLFRDLRFERKPANEL
ncbi:MAG: hypothetical protein HY791_15205 [Deltaproteobacteria bacterium]|nr:hypothetical protein [Deltaproteobacteria bacterium]